MKVNFYLNEYVASDDHSLIYAQVAWGGQHMKVYFGARVRPASWDRKRQRSKRDVVLNTLLQRAEEMIREAFMQAQMNTSNGSLVPSKAEVRSWIDRYLMTRAITREELQEQYLNSICNRITERRILGIRRALTMLEECKRGWQLSDVTPALYDKYVGMMAAESYANNTIGSMVKNVIAFLNWCKKRGHAVSTAGWHKPSEQVAIVTLTEAELASIEALELEGRLARVRSLFLVECFTGLRFSDASEIDPGALQSNALRIVTRKTRDALTIPISARARPWVEDVLETRPRISNQKLNDYLKELARLAGITEPIRRVRHSGAKRMEETFPKCELVTSHTGRRTFVTLSLEKGVRPEVLMRITGHKDIKTLMRYVHVSANVTREEMTKAWG